jgi:MFS family permease
VNRNVKVVLLVSVLFGASGGIYDFVLPYYLRSRGLSLEAMGVIFTVAAVGMFAVRILMGRLADIWGRKLFYGLALAGNALAMWITPFSASVAGLGSLKTMREAMSLTRDTLHPVVLYEESRGQFMSLIGKTRGFEYLFQAIGTAACSIYFAYAASTGTLALTSLSLRLAGALTALAFVVFVLVFRESWVPHKRLTAGRLAELFSLSDLHWNLKVIIVSTFIFNLGLMVSHSFVMPLFFSDKFGVSKPVVGWVMVGHRATIAIPLLLAGTLVTRRLKAVYIGTLAIEGAILSASALIPHFALAAGVWLLHDLVGAGVWTPIQNLIIQDYTRPEKRALEMGKLLAFGGLGTIPAPYLSGLLAAKISIGAPFFVSGLLMIIAAALLLALRLDATKIGAEPVAAAAAAK